MVEPRTVIFPSDARCQLDEFLIAEVLPEAVEQRLWDIRRGVGHAVHILQAQLLDLAVDPALGIAMRNPVTRKAPHVQK